MEAIILAGGFGTRLSHIVSDVPKPMAPLKGYPFLKYIMDYLLEKEFNHIILAVGYKAQIIQDYFGNNYQGINISYSIEDNPLGTGGAIKKALNFCLEENVFIINGDTYFNVDLEKMNTFHSKNNSSLTVAIKSMDNFERYGAVIVEENLIKKFEEKKATIKGKINGGVYLMKKAVLDITNEKAFSFEKIILESKVVDIYAFEDDGYFIDIGVPEDYYKAQKDFELENNTTINRSRC